MIYDEDRVLRSREQPFYSFWQRNNLLGAQDVPEYFKDAYKPQNAWAQIISFVLTLIAGAAAYGFITMITGFKSNFIAIMACGVLSVWFSEYRIKHKRSYKGGETQACTVIAGTCAICLFPAFRNFNPHDVYWGVSGAIVFFILGRRYLSSLAFVIAFCFLCFLLFTTIHRYVSSAALPFAFMITSSAGYFMGQRLFSRSSIIWKPQLQLLRVLCLAVLILSGNYYVVRVLSEELMNNQGEIAYAWFFYLFSMAFPIFLCYAGLKKKVREDLILGILGLLAGILGIRAYHAILPLETALSIGGLVLLAIGYLTILAFKKPMYGLSVEPVTTSENAVKLNHLLISFIVSKETQSTDQHHLESGGQFGGGGAGGKF